MYPKSISIFVDPLCPKLIAQSIIGFLLLAYLGFSLGKHDDPMINRFFKRRNKKCTSRVLRSLDPHLLPQTFAKKFQHLYIFCCVFFFVRGKLKQHKLNYIFVNCPIAFMTFSCKSFLVSFASMLLKLKAKFFLENVATAIIVEMRYGHLEPSFMISILQLIFPLQKFLQFAPIFGRFLFLTKT